MNYSNNKVVFDNDSGKSISNKSSKAFNLTKVFGYCFIGLLITGLVAFGLGYLFNLWLINNYDVARRSLLFILIGTGIALIVMTFVIQGVFLKGRHSLYIPSLIYVILMGAMLSTMTIFIDWQILGYAFLITSGIFAIMTLIALISKNNLSGLAIVGMMMIFGALFVWLFTWLFTIWFPVVNMTLSYILNFVIFAAVMLITIADLYRIGKICEQGEMSNNLSLYCAFTIYTDFIYIFIRIAALLSSTSNR